jgi:FMN phosphatase YigB (HAD superfamily)
MTIKSFYSLEKLLNEGRRLAVSCDTVSFDLFDTLLIRRIHDPDLVKIPVARYIASLAEKSGIKRSWQAVQKLRNLFEQQQRDETGTKFDDHEACYPVFMETTLRTIFADHYDASLLERVTHYELEMESSMLVPRKLLVDWLIELKSQNKRLLIISDVYLPAEHLRILVKRAGLLDLVEDVVSSADTFLAKASGQAFPLVEKRFNLSRSSWLHIGDNPISDGLRPAEFGLQALVLKDGNEKFRKAIIKRYVNYGKGRPFYRGRALQQLMLPLEAENIARPDLYREGYNFIGPIVCGFVQHIAEESRRLGLEKLFFFSREGYTFKKVWEQCIPTLFPDGDLPEIEYIYVSRMALAGASCAHQGLTAASAGIALLPPGNKDFSDIARIFQFDLKRLKPHLERHKLSSASCLSPLHQGYDQKHSLRLMELLEDEAFQDEVKDQVADAHRALISYLSELGLFNHLQIGVVDIGWLGTIQRFLYEAIKQREDCPRIHGYVFGATRGIPFPDDLQNSLQGVIYDRHRFELAASTILYARDLFEEACRAPHPTLERYEPAADGYRLKFRTKDDTTGKAEQQQDEYFVPLQQGVFDAAKAFGPASALLGFKLEHYRPWFHYLLSAKLAFPRTSEVMTMRHKHHLDDFHGSNKPLPKTIGKKTLWDYRQPALRLLPFLRLRLYLRHIREVI